LISLADCKRYALCVSSSEHTVAGFAVADERTPYCSYIEDILPLCKVFYKNVAIRKQAGAANRKFRTFPE
jgi:hypothetical protein